MKKLLLALALSIIPLSSQAESIEIGWTDLLPQEDLDALEKMPEIDHEGEGFYDEQGNLREDLLPDVLKSDRVSAEFEGQQIKIPGFIVPLEISDNNKITEFFLVPFFGACIHVPPPPPNQMIHVRYPKGFNLGGYFELADPYWIEGELKIEQESNELGKSAYAVDISKIKRYQY